MSLRELQEAFQARVLERRTDIEAELAARESTDFAARLRVYTDGYGSRLVEALGTTYPALKVILGDDEFDRTMHAFIAEVPSRFYSVRYYGERVADFVDRGRAGPAAQMLGDLARWEWVLADVFDAPDDAAAGADDMARVPAEAWAGLSLVFRAAIRRAATHSNAVAWWRSVQGEGARPDGFETGGRVDWLLWRRGIKTYFRSLEALESRVLDAALAGATFAHLCEIVAGDVEEGEAPLRAASMLRGWFADELIAKVAVPATPP